jgi:hypothetical protein
MPSNDESASPERKRDREKAAGKDSSSAPPDQRADTNEQVQEEVRYLRQTLLGLANQIIVTLGGDPDKPSMPPFRHGPLSRGPMMAQRRLRDWDYRAGPPPGRMMPRPWFGREGAIPGPPGRRRGGRTDQEEQGP